MHIKNKLGVAALTLISAVLPLNLLANDKPSYEKVGDLLAIGIPAAAYGATWLKKDKEGRSQYYKSFGATTAINGGLKLSGVGDRPHNDKTDSFPSGHVAYAFQGATFLHKRYGLKYGIPAYIGATYVGYSRLKADKHHGRDITAGLLIGAGSSWYFTTKRSNLVPIIGKKTIGLSYHKKW